jgi:hypothetical protein
MQINSLLHARSALASIAAFAACSGFASAQWVAVSLHPPGFLASTGADGAAGQQVGAAYTGPGVPKASLWSGTAASWLSLHPLGYASSECSGTDGVHQVGWATDGNGDYFAGMWSGSSNSWSSLNPLGAPFSRALAVSGNQQVGWTGVLPTYDAHAALWAGTAASFVDLNPAGSNFSIANGVAGGQQVGYATIAASPRASIWTGSAASWIDITPAGAGSAIAYGTDGVQQVGTSNYSLVGHASLWSGSAASHVDLTPPGAASATAVAIDAGEQVGSGNWPAAYSHAYFWTGSAASWYDLHSALPNSYQDSSAYAIWHANGYTFVLGTAYDLAAQTQVCVLWKKLHVATYCTAKTNSLGCVPSIGSSGSWTASAPNAFTIRATALRNNCNGLLLYGIAGRAAQPFHGGVLCFAAPRMRAPAMNSSGWSAPVVDCSGYFLFDMTAFRVGTLGGSPAPFLSLPGTTVDCQFWARDPGFAAPNNVQLTDALEFEVGP